MRGITGTMAALWLCGASIAPAHADTGAELAAKFGALESVQNIRISPDGTKIIYISPDATDSRALYIVDIANGGVPKRIISQSAPGEPITWCAFATDVRIICQIRFVVKEAATLLGFSRLVALNSDGSGIAAIDTGATSRSLGIVQSGGGIIDWNVPGKAGNILMTRKYVPEFSADTQMASRDDGLGVDSIDVVTMRRKMVEKARSEAAYYISDGKGTVRLMATQFKDANGYDRNSTTWFYRKPESRSWDPLLRTQLTANGLRTGIELEAVDSGKNVAYGFGDHAGHQALYSVSLDGNATQQVLLSRPDVDVDTLISIGRDQRVVGASYATERRSVEFFDPELKKLGEALARALPGHPNVSFVDASADESKLLLFASSDVDPGLFYLFDKATHHLDQVLPARAALEGVAMGQMKPITYTAADGTKVPAYLTLPPGSAGKGLPAIVMPHGGPGARDEWGFDWLVQFYAARGFAVIQPNYRGSAGYGSDWYQQNGFQSWRTAIGDVNDAGRYLLSEGIAAPGKLAIVGWSYGGYAALQSAVLDANLFKAVVAVAPVTDLEMFRVAWDKYTSGAIVRTMIGTGDHVRAGSPLQNVNVFNAPILMFHGDRDQNVDVSQSRVMANNLRDAGKAVTYVEFPGLTHSLSSAAARTRLLQESDAFLRKSLGIAP